MDNKNYKYSIHINQFACIESGLDLDIIDLAILDYIKDFYCSNKCIKIQTEEGIYFWVSHTKIINDMPLLRIKTKQGLIKRINNLINANVLQKHPNCDVYAKTLYKFGSNYDLLIFNQNSNIDKYQNEFTPLNESLPPPSTFVYPPLNETLGNNSIINNKELNNNNINNICDISEFEVLEYEEVKKEKENKPDLNEFLEYAEQIIIENNLGSLNEYKLAIEAKFEQWSNNDWKDGHGKPIKRWKPKLKTAFQYFKPIRQNGYGNIQQQSKEQPVIGRMSEETVNRNLQGWQ